MILADRTRDLLNDACEFDRIEGGNYKRQFKNMMYHYLIKNNKNAGTLNIGKLTFKNLNFYSIMWCGHEGQR